MKKKVFLKCYVTTLSKSVDNIVSEFIVFSFYYSLTFWCGAPNFHYRGVEKIRERLKRFKGKCIRCKIV